MLQDEYKENKGVIEQNDSSFSLKDIGRIFILHWPWFVISVFGCLFVAFLYLRYTSPVYSTYTELLIKEDDPYSRRMQNSGLAGFSQLGILNNTNGFDNEIEILNSKTLAKRSVMNLKLYVRYAYEGTVKNQELYEDTPVLADMSVVDLDTLSRPINIKLIPQKEGGYKVKGNALEEDFEAEIKGFPVRIKTLSGWVFLKRVPDVEFEDRPVYIKIYNPDIMTYAVMDATAIEPTSKMTTIVRITLNDTNTKRAKDYLNELTRVYNEDANESKNEVAVKTENFINERLKMLERELGRTESNLEIYKKENSLVDITSDAEAAYGGLEDYQKQQVAVETQMMLVKSLMDYVMDPKNEMQVIPANLGVNDESLNKSIVEYNQNILARAQLLRSASETSPVVVKLTDAIEAMLPGIRYSLQTIYDNLRTKKRNVDDQYNLFMGRLSSAPTQERMLKSIGRQQEIQSSLYQILLQKREENSISLAATAAKAQVVDAPESSLRPISPRAKIVLLIGLVLGLAIPFGIVYLLDLLRYRIEGRNDIEKLTKIPILADVFVAKDLKAGQRGIVIRENCNDMMEETFRNLRTNLGFVMKKSEHVLLCTSVIPGEGKTFISTNLAMSMALLGKKVLVIGLDIRKPRLARLFGLRSGSHGLTAYLASEDSSDEFLREQIFNSGINANLDVLPAGLIPPNPGELICSNRLDYAVSRFREWYDMVIIDTPPIGLVSDTLELGRLADASLVVCRCDYSLKRNFELINSVKAENKLPKINLVLNGVDLSQRKYGYYYGYGTYGRYGHYGHYGAYGNYGTSNGSDRHGHYIKEEAMHDDD